MTPPSTVQAWDPLLRVFHWSLVLAFTVAYASGEEWLALHVATGYAIGGLLVFRMVWGIVGPRHARFSDFVRAPTAIRAYLQDLVRLRAPRYLGHNPAGGAMVVALLLPAAVCAAPDAMQTRYRAEGAGPFDATAGASAWQRGTSTEGETRSCSTCHGTDPRQPGRHPRTGKRIEPLAPSANPQALADAGNVEKWFARNCKWTWGRECSAQEKGNFLEYLKQL